MAEAKLLISSRNYSSWSLRGYLLCRLSGLSFSVFAAAADDPQARAELTLRSSTIRLPSLLHGAVTVWDTLAIAEYLNELHPDAKMWPEPCRERAHARSISGEMHSGFAALRSSLPLNMRARRPRYQPWSGTRADIALIQEIWRGCLEAHGGPWLFGGRPTIADAMYAPVASRFLTYDVELEPLPAAYRDHILGWEPMVEWMADAVLEPEAIEELEVD
ncbi:glutathione S-transferase [Teichococcus vastitatis]|jgi:glutathione S-transferase|uniref:Glutathione S-transferase n=1 Tax=Teichococcus vastitatis TaxID=2307076 RepID=A0ABS9W3Y7_9PROT|nr:glutathione S-transferase [Pseudoroseomonas vastitatis]MCI0753991.1 glutathione S-transferase [Pseudoroseomonas vastitatis]